MRTFISAGLLSLLVAACGTHDAATGGTATGGTLVIATSADADILLPPLVNSIVGRIVTDQIFDRLAEIGDELTTVGDKSFTPRLATSWEWAEDSLSIAFHLDPRAKWHDGAPLRASDVRFTYQVYSDPLVNSPTASLIQVIDSVSVRDSLTPVFWYKRRSPEQFYDAVYQLVIIPEHLLKDVPRGSFASTPFGRNPVGTGRFRFARWDAGSTIEITADTTNFRGRATLDRVIWSIAPDFTAAATKLFAGEADFFELMRPEGIDELAKHPELTLVPYGSLDYAYIGFNLRDPKNLRGAHALFGNAAMRRAMSMAIDRETLVRSTFDSLAMVARGPFVRSMAVADTTLRMIPFDLRRARALLDSLGWKDANGDGIREKAGHELTFSLIVPNSSKNRMRMAVLVQEQLKQAGVKLELEPMEFNTFMVRQTGGRFDANFGSWHMDPSPSGTRQTWASTAMPEKGGSNDGGYVNKTFDAVLDSALAQFDAARGRALFSKAFQMILDDAPAVWMYEPRNMAGAHKRIQEVGMRADAWWARLADWSIPAAQRIDRDRIGLRAVVKK